MNGLKPLLRLLILTQTFLLFSVIVLPALVHYLQQPIGKWIYGGFAGLCIVLTVLLRRALRELE